MYEQLRAKFTVDDYSHYLFTPRDLTRWVLAFLRHDLANAQNEAVADHVLEIWAYEARRLFRDRLVGNEAQSRFDTILMSVVRADWSADVMDTLEGNCEYKTNST